MRHCTLADKNKIVRLSALSAGEQSSDIEHVAMCFGQFNVIHPGHLRYLKLARSHGSKLVVAVEGDVNLSTGHQSVSPVDSCTGQFGHPQCADSRWVREQTERGQ